MAKPHTTNDAGIFQVSGSMAFFSWLICEHPRLWKTIGNIETALLADALDDVAIDRPVYVSGLARSGSTILLEILARAPGVASLCYKDFPPVFTPYAWNWLLRRMQSGPATPAERAHKDGILVTMDSPEAMEEPLWMSFFPGLHDPRISNVIEPDCNDNGFASFYHAHIRKLLLVHASTRYLAKANYQITRFEYLLKILPDARILIPVREPAAHIASLLKQHRLFTKGQLANSRARDHLRRVGHFEFGLDRIPINTGNSSVTDEIQRAWARGDELEGWIRYWIDIHMYLLDRLAASDALRSGARFIVYEDLCANPETQLNKIMRHCELDCDAAFVNGAAGMLRVPTYYESGFGKEELATIAERTGPIMQRLRAIAL